LRSASSSTGRLPIARGELVDIEEIGMQLTYDVLSEQFALFEDS